MSIFSKIGETFTPHIFSALINSIILLIFGILFMIDVIGYNDYDSDGRCTTLTAWSFIVTGCGLALGLYAWFASDRGRFACSGFGFGEEDDEGQVAIEVDGNSHENNTNNNNNKNNNNKKQKYQLPIVYILLLLIISILNFIMSFFAIGCLDFCGGRLNLFWLWITFGAWGVAPTTIFASLLLLWRRDYLGCIDMTVARYFITNFFLVPVTWTFWFIVPCGRGRADKDVTNANNGGNNNNNNLPSPQQALSVNQSDVESNQYGGYNNH